MGFVGVGHSQFGRRERNHIMAADTDHRAYCNHLSHPSSFSSDTQHSNQDVSISELIDHGSISFGRFTAESLAWEKRSVFSHNRCQEELEKLKGPGIVAQKKAYFEEYYRKIRALKKLQSEQQEVSQSGLCEDNIYPTSQVQNSVEIIKAKHEKNLDGTGQIKVLMDNSTEHQDPPGETTDDKSLVTEKQKENYNNKVITRDQTNITLAAAENESFSEKAALAPDSSVKTCSNSSQHDTPVSITVKLNANKLKDHIPLSKTKGPVPSTRDKTKLNNRTKKDAAKPSEKGKQFLDEDISGKVNKSLVLSERGTHMPGRNVKHENFSSHRKPTKLHSSTTILHSSVSKHMPATSSSTKDRLAKANSKLGFMSKSTSSHINITNGVNDVVGKRPSAGIVGKSLESGSHFMTPNSGQSENQKPKIMSISCPAQTKPNQGVDNKFGLRDYVRSGKQIKEAHAASGRVPTAASSTPSTANKATNPKLEHKNPKVEHKKIVPWQSGDLTHAQREQRNKLPSWR